LQLPSKVAVCGLCSSDCPYAQLDKQGIGGGGWKVQMFGTETLSPEAALELSRVRYKNLEESYAHMKDKSRAAAALADLKEAAGQGLDKGISQDSLLESRDWGLDVAKVSVPVLLWHGEADDSVSVTAGKWLASQIPGCHATFLPGENHSMVRRRWGQILSTIVQVSRELQRSRL